MWAVLLGYAPFVDVLGARAVADCDRRGGVRKALAELSTAAHVQRSTRTNQAAVDLERAARKMARRLVDANVDDTSCDSLVQDVQRYADGHRDPEGPAFPRVPRHGRPFRLYVRALREAQSRAAKAKQFFVSRNIRLVMKLAHRFRGRGLPYADLVQEGTVGLIKAVERFDPERGFRFSTYAVWWIRHTLGRAAINQGREVRVPVHMAAFVRDVERKRAELTRSLAREPSSQELAEGLDVPLEKVHQAEEVARQGVQSLYGSPSADERRPLIEVLPPDQVPSPVPAADEWNDWVDGEVMRRRLRPVVESLPAVERDIIHKRFGLGGEDPMTLQQIGDEYHLSRERIRQLEARALARMRTQLPH